MFDVQGARKEGYSDAEIAAHLAARAKFNLDGARKEGYSDAEVIEHLAKVAAAPKRSAASEVGRQVGLTARYGLQGLGATVGLVSDPIGALVNQFMPSDGPKAQTARSLAAQLADTLGLPRPESGIEKVVGAAAESVAGAGALGTAARGTALAADMPAQLAGAAGAGAGAEIAEQTGAGPAWQLAASLAGGIVGSKVPGAARGANRALRSPQPGVIADAKDHGIPVMTTDVVPPKTFVGKIVQATGERIPVTGTGGARQAQQQARVSAVQELVRSYGANVETKFDERIAADLLGKRSAMLTKYTQMKRDVLTRAGGGPVDVSNTLKAIDDQLDELKLQGPAATKEGGIAKLLQDFRESLQGQSLERLDKVRALLGERITDPAMGATRTQAEKIPSAVYSVLRQDMAEHVSQTLGRRGLREWRVANGSLATMMRELDRPRLKMALNTGAETPETVRALLFSAKASDVRSLWRSLTPAGRQNAQAALLQSAFEKAAKDGAERLSPKIFANELGRLSDATGVMFGPAEKGRIEGLRRVLIATQRASDAAAAPPTGVQGSQFVGGALLTDMMGTAGGAVAAMFGYGAAARIYESRVMRDILLRLSTAKEGTKQYATLLDRAVAQWPRLVQAHQALEQQREEREK